MRLLVSRTDRIGDVVLTLPLCGLLQERLGATVVFLGRAYTRPVLEACPAVAEVLDWDEAAPPAAQRALLAGARADAVLHVFPRAAVARAAWRAGIPRRIGTSRRAFHWLYCNRLERVSRRGSDLHEAQLNLLLARTLLPDLADPARLPAPAALAPHGRLVPRAPLPADVAALLPAGGDGRCALVVHPRSLGSAREWPLAHWSALVAALDPARFRVLVTGSAAEGEALAPWLATLPTHAYSLCGRLSLAELLTLLARVDGVVAASTGPAHLAAAVGTRVLGLYPPTRPMHPGRWAPIGPRAEWLAAAAPCAGCAAGHGAAGCTCMAAIGPERVLARVERWAAERAAERTGTA